MLNKLSNLKELFHFLWKRKLWWLIPMIVVFIVIGVLIAILASTPLGPLVYPLF